MEATMNIKRNLLIVSLLVVLVLPTSFAFAAGIEDVKGVNYAHCESNKFVQTNSLSYSGDDLYDSAADLLCAVASADIIFYSANPELLVAQRYAVAAPVSSEINSFSANPELSNAQRYTEAKAKRAEIGGSLSDNPELSVAQFTTDVSPVSSEINSFSANPELMVAQRYAVAASVSAETKDCFADCYDNY